MPVRTSDLNDYPGRGIIKCTICGKPCRDHPIEPCSHLNLKYGEKMYAGGQQEAKRRYKDTK